MTADAADCMRVTDCVMRPPPLSCALDTSTPSVAQNSAPFAADTSTPSVAQGSAPLAPETQGSHVSGTGGMQGGGGGACVSGVAGWEVRVSPSPNAQARVTGERGITGARCEGRVEGEEGEGERGVSGGGGGDSGGTDTTPQLAAAGIDVICDRGEGGKSAALGDTDAGRSGNGFIVTVPEPCSPGHASPGHAAMGSGCEEGAAGRRAAGRQGEREGGGLEEQEEEQESAARRPAVSAAEEFEIFLERERRALGPMSFAERSVAVHGLLLVLLWFTRRSDCVWCGVVCIVWYSMVQYGVVGCSIVWYRIV